MNPLQPWPMSLIQRDASLSDEVEVLQTDVMRFFAILCLCLMAIFALVKTLPMAPQTDGPALVEPVNIKADAAALQNQIAVLKKKLAELRTQVHAAAIDAEKSTSEVANAEKKEHEILARLTKAQQEFKRVSESLDETRGALKVREMKLAEMMNDLDNKQRTRTSLQSQIASEKQQLAEIQAKLEQDKKKMSGPPPPSLPAAETLPEESATPQSGRKGFTLRFASDAALQQLISRGMVNFYALAGEKAWQLHLRDEQAVYVTTQFPRQIYEMQTSTVPLEYAGVFQRQVAAFGRATVTWGVTLPSQTIASINRLTHGRDGGDLVIAADGKVVIN